MHKKKKKERYLFFILGKGLTNGLDDTALTAEKKYFINFTEKQKKFI